MRTVTMLAVVLVTLLGPVAPALAEDEHPCGKPRWHDGVELEVQECTMWRGSVPVMSGFKGDDSQTVVGELVNATGNWFTCQLQGASYQVPGTDYVDDWWAATMADNGEWGFVNQAYFAGGDNNEPDANLRPCAGEPAAQEIVEVEWSDCIWGGEPDDRVIHSVRAKDDNTYTLNCERVIHVREGHGFNDRTIGCIDLVLTSYDAKGKSKSNPLNDVFQVKNLPMEDHPGNFVDAFVVTNRESHRIVTAFVELSTVDNFYPYDGDEWSACIPSPSVA